MIRLVLSLAVIALGAVAPIRAEQDAKNAEPAAAVAAVVTPYDALKAKYDEAGKVLAAETTAQREYLKTAYGKSVDKLTADLQQAGNLEALLVIKDEKARFEREKTVPTEAPAGAPAGWVTLLQRYASAVQKCDQDDAKKKYEAADRYAGQLRALVKKLTVDGKIGDAMVVNEETKRTAALVEQLKASVEMASAPVRPVVAATPRAVGGPLFPSNIRESALAAVIRSYRGGEAVKVDLASGHAVKPDTRAGGGGTLFDGTDSYLKVPGNIPTKIGTRDFTLVLEFCAERQAEATAYILEQHKGFPWVGLFVAIENNKNLRFRLKDLPHCDISFDISDCIGDGKYHHLALTRQGRKLEACLDGKQVESASKPELVDLDIDYGNPLMVGVHCEKMGAWYRGGLRNMAFFIGEALSKREIDQVAR